MCCTFSFRQAASKPSATKQEPRSVSTCVILKGKARIASFRKAIADAVVSLSLTARCTPARAAVDGQIEVALAGHAIAVAQLGQVLHIQVHEAKIILLEGAMRWRERLAAGRRLRPSAF